MEATPRFLNGVYDFTGTGLHNPAALSTALSYTVPSDKRTQLIYFRAGNSSDAMVALTLVHNGKPIRFFPVGAKGAVHVPLAVVEDLFPDSLVQVYIAAPAGTSGTVVVDVGMIEV